MRKTIILCIMFLSMGILYFFSGLGLFAPRATYAGQKTIITLACETSLPDFTPLLLKKFKEIAEAKAKEDLEIRFFPGGSLGTQRQNQQQVQLGTIQAIGTGSDMIEMEPKFSFVDFPFLFNSPEMVYRVLDGPIGQKLNQKLIREKGVRILCYGELGFRQITNRVRPIVNPDDLKGLKIRVPPVKLRVAAFKAMGAAATPIPYKELYTSLQQKVVDGQENPVVTVEALSLWDVQKYISLSNHVYTPTYLLINEKFWQSLSPKMQNLLQKSAIEARDWNRRESQNSVKTILEKAKAKGMKVNKINPEPFAELARPVWDQFADKVGKDILEEIISMQ